MTCFFAIEERRRGCWLLCQARCVTQGNRVLLGALMPSIARDLQLSAEDKGWVLAWVAVRIYVSPRRGSRREPTAGGIGRGTEAEDTRVRPGGPLHKRENTNSHARSFAFGYMFTQVLGGYVADRIGGTEGVNRKLHV